MVSSAYKLIAGLQVVPISDDDDGVGCIIHLVTLYALSGYQGNCGPPHIHRGLPADPALAGTLSHNHAACVKLQEVREKIH